MISIALIGPDGAGKTTVARHLEKELGLPVKYLYMGVSTESSNIMFPTTKLIHEIKRFTGAPPDTGGPPDPAKLKSEPKSRSKKALWGFRATLRLLNRLTEESFRQLLAWYYLRQGYFVLFDRHFYSDFYAYDIVNKDKDPSFTRRIHGYFLQHFYPKPDLLIYLDAPAKILLARKGEGTLDLLERRRSDYLQMRDLVENFIVIDASQPLDIVINEIKAAILDFSRTKFGVSVEAQNA